MASAFQTYDKEGGIVRNKTVNKTVSYVIMTSVVVYVLIMFFSVLMLVVETGADEPQIIFIKSLLVVLMGNLIVIALDPTFQMLTLSAFMVFVLGFLYINRLSIFKKMGMSKLASKVTVNNEGVMTKTKTYMSRLSTFIFGTIVGFAVFLSPLWASAQIVEPGFESETVVDGFSLGVSAAFAPDGRIFVAEKGGTVKVIKNDVLLSEPLITLTDVNTFGDRGLLGIAVDPDFANNGYLYLSYTYENTPGSNVAGPKTGKIVRVTVVGDTADESSKVVLVGTVDGSAAQPSCEDFDVTADCIASDSSSHSVGGLRFGPDGKLYATLGDGADFADVDPRALRAQNIDSLAGKVLRINTDGTAPSDNPFYDGDPNSNRSKVYALGVRNMFRINFDPSTGKLYGGDVGWSSWEEVNEIVPGANYGWPCREGNGAQPEYNCTPSSPATDPLYTYPHNSSGAGSITGGAFLFGSAYPESYGTSFLIADYAQMWMKRVVLDSNGDFVSVEDFVNGNIWPVEIINGPDGNVYYLDIVFGSLVRITHTDGNRSPVVNISAGPTSGLSPLTVDFSSAGTVDPDDDAITYAWDFADGNTSTEANPTHTYTTDGTYLASLEVTDSHGASKAKNISITVGNQAPQASITSPASGSLYKELESVSVSGEGNDPEDGTLPASAFEWTVLLHHNTHVHTVQQFSGVKDITFIADDHNDPDVYMEIILTVTDSVGLTSSKSINMYLDNGIGSGNLIQNPSMELEGAIPSSPLGFNPTWWGTMNPIFTYPVAGFDGERGGKIVVDSYTAGGAMWSFSPVFVSAGEEYIFKNQYTATVPTDLIAQYKRPDGTLEYVYIATVPATDTPTENSYTFTIPEGIETATIFHEIYTIGELVVDDFSLTLANEGDTEAPTGNITNINNGDVLSGVVSVEVDTADNEGVTSVSLMVDGAVTGVGDSEPPFAVTFDTTAVADGSHTLSALISDTSGNQGTAPDVTVTVNNSGSTTTPPTGNNLILNGNLEINGGNGNPANWNQNSWGTNTPIFTYPTTGVNGNGAKVELTSHTDGDAKWYADDVAITGNTEYTIGDTYNSTVDTEMIIRYTKDDSSVQYVFVQTLPNTNGAWQTFEQTITTPADAVSMTLFHIISAVGELTIDEVKVVDPSATSTPDTTAPTVSVDTPNEGATVNGNVNVTVTANDNVAVAGVTLLVDDVVVGTEDITSPYSFTWDSSTVADGAHTIKAVARDTSNNETTSAVVNVTVDNSGSTTTPPTGNNLILNGDLETNGTGGNPANWNQNSWGTNSPIFTYPTTGVNGNGAKVELTSHTDGDAKWYADDVAITGNTEYTIGDTYNSTVDTEMIIRYTKDDSSVQYVFVQTLPNTNGAWQTFEQTITTPADAVSMTLFHIISAVGELTIDDIQITDPNGTGGEDDTENPTVSVDTPSNGATVSDNVNVTVTANDNVGVAGVKLLVDGAQVGSEDTNAPYTFSWDSTTVANGDHTITAEARDAAGNTAVATEITMTVDNEVTPPPSGDNLIHNGNFEIVDGDNPEGWAPSSWGDHTTEFNYPVAGSDGGSAVEVVITDYPADGTGDSRWTHTPIAVSPGIEYTYTTKYKAGTISDVIGRYEFADGSEHYFGVVKEIPPSADWAEISGSFVPPENTVEVTLHHLISAETTLTIDEVGLFVTGTGTPAETNIPVVEFVDPLEGDTISGTVTLTASSSDDTGVVGVFFALDGTPLDDEDTTSPYQFVLDTTLYSDGEHVLKATTRDPYGNNDKAEITVTIDNSGTPPPADTEDPTVSVDTPNDGATVSGNVNTIIIANDNVGVEGVRLFVDGVQIGSEDTNAPYTFSWDSTTVANGEHTITAEARDAAGNTAIADEITVTVDNEVTPPTGDNLVENADLEAGSDTPDNWNQNSWGTNTPVFTYPVAGETGNGAKVEMTDFTDGDAKWYFDDVSVDGDTIYTVGDSYNSNVETMAVVRYTLDDDSVAYALFESLPSTGGSWDSFSSQITTPSNAVSLTLFHVIAGVGELTVDNASVISS